MEIVIVVYTFCHIIENIEGLELTRAPVDFFWIGMKRGAGSNTFFSWMQSSINFSWFSLKSRKNVVGRIYWSVYSVIQT